MFSSLAIIVVLSFLIPFVAIRFTGGVIPSVALELIAGIVIGTSGLNLVDVHNQTMEFLSTFGLIYLMFLGGLESRFDFSGLRSRDFVHSPIFIAVVVFLLTLVFSYLFSFFLIRTYGCGKSVFYLTLVFSTTSVAIVFPTLKSRPDIKKAYRETIIASALIADFATLFMITVFTLLREHGNGFADFTIMLSIFIFAYLLKKGIHIALKRPWVVRTIGLLKHKPHIQMGIRASFAILFIFLFLAEKLGIEIILGSFIAGMLISRINRAESEVLLFKLDAIGYGFFIPFFFIYQGAKSELGLFSGSGIVFVLVIIVGSYLIKILASLMFKIRFSWRETIAAGVLLSGRLSLIIAASIIGVKLGIIDDQTNSAIILLAAVSCVLSPSLFGLIERKRFERAPGRIIIVGGGSVGSSIAKHLAGRKKPIVLIEKDPEVCDRLRKECDVDIRCFEARSVEGWESVRPTPSDTALLVTDSDEINLETARMLKERYGLNRIFARDNNPSNRKRFEEMGVTPLIYTETLIKSIENAIENPATFELISGTERHVVEKRVDKLSGSKLREVSVGLPADVILVKRNGEWVKPTDDYILKRGDVLILMVDKKDEELLERVEF